jgi:tetratricopeptide (TPR) repeat protein
VAHGKQIPFLPILDLFRDYFGISPEDGEQDAREKIAGRMLLLDEGLRDSLPLVFDFLGVSDPERQSPPMDAETRRRQLFAIIQRVTQARSRRAPAITLIEDLHWLDPASEAIVEVLVEAAAGIRSLLLLNFRPEFHAAWMQRSSYQQLPLVPLGPEAIEALLLDLLGPDPTVHGLAATIHARTAGNPFFAEEVVQALIEAGSLEGSRGAYRLVTPVEKLLVPASVQAVLAARIDRLAEREKAVLQAAAVIGKEFSEPILRAALEAGGEEPELDLAAALATLKRAEFVYEEALYPVAEYAFKHPLTQEVALASQLRDTRQRRHGAVAQVLATHYADKSDEHAALIAYHFEEAGAALEAARWHRCAAEWIGYSNVEEAVRHWRRIPVLLDGASDSEAADLVRAAVQQILIVGGLEGIGREEADALLATGRRLADDSRDPQALPQMLIAYATARVLGGDAAAGLGLFQEAAVLARDLPDQSLYWYSRGRAAWALLSLGRLRESLAECEAIPNASGSADPMELPPRMHVWVLIELGRLHESARVLAQLDAKSGMESVDSGFESRLHAHLGQLDRGLRTAGESVAFAERSHAANMIAVSMTHLGRIQTLRAQWPEAVAALERGLRVAREAGTMLNLEAETLAGLARAYLGQGDLVKALATAQEAVAVARARGARHHEAAAHIVHADVLLALAGSDGPHHAAGALHHAETLLAETGAQLIAPDLHVSRAALARQLGDTAAAERELREARRLLTEMGATGHLERLDLEWAPA